MVVLSLGGTIVGERTEGGYIPSSDVGDVIASAGEGAEVTTVEVARRPSADLDFADILRTAAVATEAIAAGAAAVVVLTGTDTLEEVAFALDLLWDRAEPLVVTGAMRPPDAPGSDGPANVAAALAVARDRDARDRGVLVVFHDLVYRARHIRKVSPSLLAAFDAAPWGATGTIIESRVRFAAPPPAARPTVPLSSAAALARVAVVPFALGADATLLRATGGLGFDAVVIEGSGGGSVAADWARAAGDLVASGIPVVYASRTRGAPVLTSTYGDEGGEVGLRARGVWPAGELDGLKARLALSLLMGSGARGAQLATRFLEIAGEEERDQ